ncbi:MAG: galactose mutarotase [Alphaproteobacteria bacterium]|nr:galactose mutarotase [Alphaproteobacteria bacterium]
MLILPAQMAARAAPAKVTIAEAPFGTLADGTKISRFTMTNGSGASVSVMPLGAAVLSISVPDRGGQMADVVLGYDTPGDYKTNNSPMYGLTIGRYANRIVGTEISIGGKSFTLAAPPGRGGAPATSVMHGGPDGFSNRVWKAARVHTKDGDGLRFTLVSPDGDQGYPGKLTTSLTYVWTADNRLILDYAATTTKPTVLNLTNHSYFNLAGAGHGDVLNQLLKIDADFFTFALPNNNPTGEVRAVKGTAFDFSTAKPIGQDIEADDPQMKANRGYNQNYVLRRSAVPGELAEAAVLTDPASGRTLTVSTTEPGLFLYTANFINTTRLMKGGVTYPLRAGVAMEIGHFPDAPHQTHFPRTTLMPNETFHARTVWAFGVK